MSASPSRRASAGFQWLPLVLAAAGAGAILWFAAGPSGWFRAERAEAIRGVAVNRGPLEITVVERGNLKAADSVSMKSEIEGQTTILYLIAEGTHVTEGELLCELDATELVDDRFQQEIAVRNADAAYVKSKQNFQIQESQNKSDVAEAEQNLEFAKADLAKFLEGEKGSRIDEATEAITLATEEFARAEEKLSWSQKLAERGFLTETELEADRLALKRSEILLEQAKRGLDLLERFQLPRDQTELEGGLREAERELERVNLQAKARLVDFEADMTTNEAKLQLEQEKLAKLESQIAKARMIAPRAGMVVYGTQDQGMRYGSSEPIQEGTQVRERQEIITIPSASGMIARASLHESVLKQVHQGQSCRIRVDAMPGSDYRGRVSFVALLPDQNSWWANPNMRVYRTDVAIEGTHPEMRPGMSCSIEIQVEQIEDTLYVPVQAVFRQAAGNVCFVAGRGANVERTVEVGRYNDKWVQILTGLEEGEVVLMSPPPGFAPKEAVDEAGATPEGDLPPGGAPSAAPAGAPPAAATSEASSPDAGKRASGPLGERLPGGFQGDPAARERWLQRMREGGQRGEGAQQGGERSRGSPGSEADRRGPERSGAPSSGSGGSGRERNDRQQSGGQDSGDQRSGGQLPAHGKSEPAPAGGSSGS